MPNTTASDLTECEDFIFLRDNLVFDQGEYANRTLLLAVEEGNQEPRDLLDVLSCDKIRELASRYVDSERLRHIDTRTPEGALRLLARLLNNRRAVGLNLEIRNLLAQ